VVIRPIEKPREAPLTPQHNFLRRRRFVPRHDDELELEVDDPLLVEVQSEDYWYEGYNMRSGAHGIFPAYYAIEVTKDTDSCKGTDSAPPVDSREAPALWFGPRNPDLNATMTQ